MNNWKTKLENKICFVYLHGKSIERLETEITKYRVYSIIHIGLNLYTVFEDFILNKINKKLNIIFDCSSVSDEFLVNYETNIRLPRMESFLGRKEDNLWITTYGMIRDSLKYKPQILENYKNKIFVVDNIFPQKRVNYYMSVPNSVCLLIAFLIWARVKKIILFGMDGYTKDGNNINSYYKPEIQAKEHLASVGKVGGTGLNRDTILFQKRFPDLLTQYRRLFNNNFTDLVNCSPNSYFTVIRKINYEDLEKELK